MEGLDPRAPLVVFGFLAFAILLVTIFATYDIRRRRGLAAAAQQLGFAYEREAPGLLGSFERFRMLPVGTNRRITNVLSGQRDDMRVWLFDYSYWSRARNQFTVCAVRSPALHLPWFSLRCRLPGVGWLETGAARAMGQRPLRFADEAFDRKFVVDGRPERVEALFDEDLRQYLRRFAGTLVRIEGRDDLLLFTTGDSVMPRRAEQVIRDAAELAAMLAARSEAVAAVPTRGQRTVAAQASPDVRKVDQVAARAAPEAARPRWATVGRPVPRALLFVAGACLLLFGGRLMLTEINATVAGTAQPLSRTFVLGLACFVFGLGACWRGVFEGAQKRRKQRRVAQDLQALASLERLEKDQPQAETQDLPPSPYSRPR